jgi:DNA-binding NtrC family response regulator
VDLGQQMLERLGYNVVARTSSIEALELFKVKPHAFDMLITDLTMLNMTGEKLVQELIKIRAEIPTILCTGHSQQLTEKKAQKIGIKAVLLKPIVMGDLAATIRKIFDDE